MAAEVHRGRPITLREHAARAEGDVRAVLACNVNPRYSLASALDREQLRAAKSAPWVPGRVPAPRGEIGCARFEGELAVGVGVFPGFARGASPLPPSTPGGPPGRPPPGPGPPEVPTPVPVPPGEPGPPGGGPPVPPGGPGPEPSPEGPGGPRMHGRPRTLTFHLHGAIGGGAVASEVRVGPRMDRPFLIRSVEVLPLSGVTVGQFVDVLVSSDENTADVALPTGASIFEPAQNLSGLPAEDQDRALPVREREYDVPMAFEVTDPGRVLKVVQRFRAPAISLAAVSVVIVVEEFDGVSVPPIEPRPPVGPEPPPILPGPPPSSESLTTVCVVNPWPRNCDVGLPRFYVGSCQRPYSLCGRGVAAPAAQFANRWVQEVVLEVGDIAARMRREPQLWG